MYQLLRLINIQNTSVPYPFTLHTKITKVKADSQGIISFLHINSLLALPFMQITVYVWKMCLPPSTYAYVYEYHYTCILKLFSQRNVWKKNTIHTCYSRKCINFKSECCCMRTETGLQDFVYGHSVFMCIWFLGDSIMYMQAVLLTMQIP
jgi:hypothetical protein